MPGNSILRAIRFVKGLGRALSGGYRRRQAPRPGESARREMGHSVHLTVEGKHAEGSLTVRSEGEAGVWLLRWPGGEISFTPPESTRTGLGYPGDEVLRQFLAQELNPKGIVLNVCGTCAYFRFSGMSWDMSLGWVGYCHRRRSTEPADTVGVLDWCPEWEARKGKKRGNGNPPPA